MKIKLIITLIVSFIAFKSNAQVYINYGQDGQYYSYPAFDKFVGTWKYVNGQDTLIVEFKKFFDTIGTYTEDFLVGYHRYIKNDSLYDDSFVLKSQNKRSKATAFLSTNAKQPYDPNFLLGAVQNYGTKRIRHLQLEYLANGNIKWTTWPYVIKIHHTNEVPSYANPLPTEVILVKQ